MKKKINRIARAFNDFFLYFPRCYTCVFKYKKCLPTDVIYRRSAFYWFESVLISSLFSDAHDFFSIEPCHFLIEP